MIEIRQESATASGPAVVIGRAGAGAADVQGFHVYATREEAIAG